MGPSSPRYCSMCTWCSAASAVAICVCARPYQRWYSAVLDARLKRRQPCRLASHQALVLVEHVQAAPTMPRGTRHRPARVHRIAVQPPARSAGHVDVDHVRLKAPARSNPRVVEANAVQLLPFSPSMSPSRRAFRHVARRDEQRSCLGWGASPGPCSTSSRARPRCTVTCPLIGGRACGHRRTHGRWLEINEQVAFASGAPC